jgi:glucosamine--fructose-6-phosphate aminotransferase (isomerizing)
MEGLGKVSEQFREILKMDQEIKTLCEKLVIDWKLIGYQDTGTDGVGRFKHQKSLLLLGRGAQHATALEGTFTPESAHHLTVT